MENSTIILITWSVTISLLYIGRLIKNNRLFKDINHQIALVSVLRYRLKDKPDNSKEFTLKELKEINVWSGKAVNDIYIEGLNKPFGMPFYGYTPTVDNTGEPPMGDMPVYKNPPKPPKKTQYKYNRLIKTDKQYENALIRINDLMDAKANKIECDELELLEILVNHYEEQELRECRDKTN